MDWKKIETESFSGATQSYETGMEESRAWKKDSWSQES